MAFYHIDSNLNMRKTINFKRIVIILLIIITILAISLVCAVNNVKVLIKNNRSIDTIYVNDITLNDSSISKELIKLGCILPNVALAQAKVETGHYKSKVCLQNKNLFGIKKHSCKYVIGENLNHATYNSYRDNIKCYLHIQNHYLSRINGRYAEAPEYVTNLKQIK